MPAAGSSVAGLQARAATIASRIETTDTRLQVLSEEYDQARLRDESLQQQISSDRASIVRTAHSVRSDAKSLRRAAIAAYIGAGSGAGLSAALIGDASSLPLQQAYLAAAAASLGSASTSLTDSEHRLSVRRSTLERAETAAAQSRATLSISTEQAKALLSGLESTQSQVKGRLAAAVAQQEAIQQRQVSARDRALQAAAGTVSQAAAQPPPSPPAAPATTPSGATAAAGGSAGATAVAAAESQEGVPYVWGGATPGQGFDCSGLAMWAWGQAGVNLPHSAQEQYDSIEHVSMSQLQPGDLIFYASGGYIYHVIMYIGGGEAVQAEQTGTVIQVTPVWPGAYGAGRP
jgi:cell wall-associated NlpC family hydrolase